MDLDPALAKHWEAKAAEKPPPDRNGRRPRAARPSGLEDPAIRQQAIARYIRDEAAAQVAGMQVKRAPPARDLRAIRWTGRWALRLYEGVRGFLIAHAGFVFAQKREYRLTACRGCTWRKDRGDGLMHCPLILAACKCPVWGGSSLPWVTRLRRKKCPIGRWDGPEKAADEAVAAQTAPTGEATSRSTCGK